MAATFESAPVIDVSKHNVKEVWSSLNQAIKSATFIAIDTELSGIGTRNTLMAKSIEDRYTGTAQNAKSRAVVSLGLSCFKLINVDSSHALPSQSVSDGENRNLNGVDSSRKKVAWHFLIQTYNIMTLCQESYVVEPASLQFLVEHGFDFNKQYSTGIPYYRGTDKTDSETENFSHLRELFVKILLSKKPMVFHNALVDLIFLYQNFYADLPQKMSTFLADLTEMFPGGILDTKYITDFVHRMPASYLEYVFRKSQRENLQKQQEKLSCVTVSFPVYPPSAAVNYCRCNLPKNDVLKSDPDHTTVDHLKDTVCQVFAGHGWCGSGSGCKRSHDIDLILDLDYLVQTRKSRKRKRRRDKQDQANLSGSEDSVSMEMEGNNEHADTFGGTAGSSSAPGSDKKTIPSENNRDKNICQAGCHRAGFDAFMTGFSLAYYLSQYGSYAESFDLNECGIDHFKNCLYLSGKDMPLTVVKSSFSKVSKDHNDKMERLQNR